MTRFRSMVTENVGLKLLSLGMAIALWITVGSAPVSDASFWVPVEFINVPANLEVLIEQPSVQVRARGPSYALRRATPGDFKIRVNLASITGPVERSFSLHPGEVAAPAPLEVVELIPANVRVTLEDTAAKMVPIDPRFSGNLPAEYRVGSFRVNPSTIRISGPASHVNSINAVSTDPLDLTNVAGEKTFLTNLYVPDALIRFLRPRTVEVIVKVERTETTAPGR